MSLNKQLDMVYEGMKTLKKNSDHAISDVLNSVKSVVPDGKFEQYKDIIGRLTDAKLKGDTKKIKALTRDLEKITQE